MQIALLITGIGMGLVFVAILFMWAMMELLVRWTAEKKAAVAPVEPTDPVDDPQPPEQNGRDKKKIAAVAVATALQLRRRQAAVKAVQMALASRNQTENPVASPGAQSNWQAAMRATQRENRLRLFERKPRGR